MTGLGVGCAILAVFWMLMVASIWEKSLTMDEGGDFVAGYTYWKYHDFRLRPEHGNLPMRWIALPLVLSGFHPPLTSSPAWQEEWADGTGYEWLYRTPGNNAIAMRRLGAATAALFAVALGALVWLWSRKLFGPTGGFLSLLLYVLCPTVLANGPLILTDMAVALFLFASVWSLWELLHCISVGRLFGSALIMGGLFISKQSAILIVPIAMIMLAARLISGQPLTVNIFGQRDLIRRGRQAAVFGGAAIFHALIVVAVIWAAYGFRYSAFPSPSPDSMAGDHPMLGSSASSKAAGMLEFMEEHRVLPQAYLHGCVFLLEFSGYRRAFMNGEFGIFGWKSYFPYTFLVKTPLPVFAIIGLALAAAAWSRRQPSQRIAPASAKTQFYDTIPLWTLFILYWAAVLPSHLDIGHRYILVIYPPLFVLCGVAGRWLEQGKDDDHAIRLGHRASRGMAVTLCALIILLAADVFHYFPNYLAYFNALVQPTRAYRHLVDSSLDWGQDLPGVKSYIDHHPSDRNYLAYSGNADAAFYKIPAANLYSCFPMNKDNPILLIPLSKESRGAELIEKLRPRYDRMATVSSHDGEYGFLFEKPETLKLKAGTYFIGATILQPVTYDFAKGPWGPWNTRYENYYQKLRETIRPLLQGDLKARTATLMKRTPKEWEWLLDNFETFRFARLTAYLRSREPDDTINFSILVYHLTDADLGRALEGAPAELGLDRPSMLAAYASQVH